jgi:branched-chain amino acid transport system substrate-binding protein
MKTSGARESKKGDHLVHASCIALALAVGLGSSAYAQFSDELVKVGVLTDMSSRYADGTGKGSLVAAQMAAEDFGGRVQGRPIEVIAADHQNKPDVGTSIARSWYDNEKVDIIVDVPTSSIALPLQNITREKDKVLIVSGAGTSDLTGKACSPNGIHWTYDTYSQSSVAVRALLRQGQGTWFFLTVNNALGQALERDAAGLIKDGGGKVLGSVKHPLNTADFSSFILQAQNSGAAVFALANAGGDTTNAIKQAAEFGLTKQQTVVALLFQITDAFLIGAKDGQGLAVVDAWYWDQDDPSREFSKRFYDRVGHMPTMLQTGVYSGLTHYLKAVDAAGTDRSKTVIAKMKELPVNDLFVKNGRIRDDGRMVHSMYLRQMKSSEESNGPWDLYKTIAEIPAEQAFLPLSASECPLVTK